MVVLYRNKNTGQILRMSKLGFEYLTKRSQDELEVYENKNVVIPDVLINSKETKKRGRYAKVQVK